MADKGDIVNAGEQISTPPSALPLRPDEQFRLINQRLDKLAGEVEKVSKPPTFRIADVIQLVAIVAGFVIAGLTALGLSERISDIDRHQTAMEQRLDDRMSTAEQRIGSRLDRMNDQFTTLDQRTSRIEGARAITPPRSPN